ncbi:MAG TPA: isochorismate synthase [Pseudonocardiaceae bacterium]|nr:isochorismate synthase [Pseudonocardiaceae bacterium]
MNHVHTRRVGSWIDLLAHLPETAPVVAWLRNGEGLVGWGEAIRIPVGTGDDRFARAQEDFTAFCASLHIVDFVNRAGTGPVAFGSFAFDPRSSDSVLVVPRVILAHRDGHSWLTTIGGSEHFLESMPRMADRSASRIRYFDGARPVDEWLDTVETAVGVIRSGALAKVVLARDEIAVSSERIDVRVLLRRLVRRFPECFAFACDGLVGATPELLVRRTGAEIHSIVLAGSANRGTSPQEDHRIGTALLHSPKNLEEHHLAVQSVARTLESHCAVLDVAAHPSLLTLTNVQHLATQLTGRLAADASVLDLVAALHPTAAVCGTPTADALELIRGIEGMDRGRYAGPVGWLDARGDGEWGIALRCAEITGNKARLFAGCGIVAASSPSAELEESEIKLGAMRYALDGLDADQRGAGLKNEFA